MGCHLLSTLFMAGAFGPGCDPKRNRLCTRHLADTVASWMACFSLSTGRAYNSAVGKKNPGYYLFASVVESCGGWVGGAGGECSLPHSTFCVSDDPLNCTTRIKGHCANISKIDSSADCSSFSQAIVPHLEFFIKLLTDFK